MKKELARQKAAQIVSQMTLEEKCSQMLFTSPAIERLGIPAYNWWNEALHGVARAGLATMFPQSIGLAATFDQDLVGRIGQVIGQEGRIKNEIARSESDRIIYKGLTFWSPNINIVRDPRWGRAHETYGEDPYLTSRMGTAFVKGIQEEDKPGRMQAAACVKHFAAHSGPEAIRHGFDAKVSLKDMAETYLAQFERVIKDAHPAGVMSSYNAVNGVPTSCNKWLLQDVLRRKWGFDGYIVSDCGAVQDIYDFHHYTETKVEAAGASADAGLELNCGSMFGYLYEAVVKGYVSQDRIDRSVTDLFTLRCQLELDEPVEDSRPVIDRWLKAMPAYNELNLKAARESMVLLKNDGILPLNDAAFTDESLAGHSKTVAVIGPTARSTAILEGNYNGTAEDLPTPYSELKKAMPGATFLVSDGCHLYKKNMQAESEGSGDRLSEAAAFARYADVTILFLGLDHTIEGEQGDASNEYAAGDKHDLLLPDSQKALLKTVCSVTSNVIVVLTSGGALELGPYNDKVRAVLQAWYPGSQGGRAIAEVLTGRVDPTGRLPETFYYNDQVDWDFADYNMEGKTYRFFHKKPLYPFGYGMQYKKLELSGFKVDKSEDEKGVSTAVITVSNPHDQTVSMPVELYAKVEEEGVRTPNFQLIGFKRVTLEAGKSVTVTMPIDPYWISVVDEDGSRRPATGKITYYAGDHQPDERSEELCGDKCLKA